MKLQVLEYKVVYKVFYLLLKKYFSAFSVHLFLAIKDFQFKHMEICSHCFFALFPLVASAKQALSDCVVDGNCRLKFNGWSLHEV